MAYTILNLILGAISIISFIIATWQYFESKYYQKINNQKNEQISYLLGQNLKLLQNIDKTSQQTIKHKDMNILLPKLFQSKKDYSFINSEIKREVNKGFNKLKGRLDLFKKEFKSQPKVSKRIEEIDSKIEETKNEAFENINKNSKLDNYITHDRSIKDLGELKEYIKFFEWLSKEPRRFVKEYGEIGDLINGKKEYYTYKFPEARKIVKIRGVGPSFFDFHEEFIKVEGDKIELSKLGIDLLKRMKEIYSELSKKGSPY